MVINRGAQILQITTRTGRIVPPLFSGSSTAYLMAQDRSLRVLELVSEFKEQVGVENDGWEIRFANKFAYIYAAMVMGIEAGILPWKAELPLRAAGRHRRG